MIDLSSLKGETVDHKPYHSGKSGRDPMSAYFIAWDGEGITPGDQAKQNYVLFGNSAGYKVQAFKLTTMECLALIITTEQAHPKAIHVGFAFSYDVEMMLCDLSLDDLKILRAKGQVYFKQYRIEFRRGKWLELTDREQKVTARIWDVWGFFQSSFVAAIKKNIGDIPELHAIEQGKSGRGQFTYDELESGYIQEYWQLELSITVKMMDQLRDRLYKAGLMIRHWHGPAAIATFGFRQHGVGKFMDKNTPENVLTASRYAYAGGRFELFQLGHHDAPVYAYDIRSAYPSAIRLLPNLSTGIWRHVVNPKRIARFGVYRISFASPSLFSTVPMPFFYRDARSAIHFPNVVNSWVWSPEASLAHATGATVHEGWVFEDDGTYPLAWVTDIYNTRAKWKSEGNPSEMALKLFLNSMYGKFAQQIGWERTGKAPEWHQYDWAGYVTSHARAQIFRAMVQAQSQHSLIGVETDGIFSSKPLNLDVGPELGQWEVEQYDAMVYLQSGFYFKRQGTEWSAKYRGFDKSSVNIDSTMAALERWTPWDSESQGLIVGTTTRFETMGNYLRFSDPESHRNVWHTATRTLSLGSDGKRIHRSEACHACKNRLPPSSFTHDLTIHTPVGGNSYPRQLGWLGNNGPANPYRDIERDE